MSNTGGSGPRGINPDGGFGGTIMMYGGSPTTDRLPWKPDQPTVSPFVPTPMTPYLVPTTPNQPDTLESMVARLKHRVAWLENELRMHEAWRTELATLKRMLESYEAPSASQPEGAAREPER